MRFSNQFGINRTKKDEWFDLVLTQDTPLYVDPFLVFDDKDPFWAGCRDDVVEFFTTVAGLIHDANGDLKSPAYRKALRLLTFPEPKEFALGVAMGSPNGAGTSMKFAVEMAKALDFAAQHNVVGSMASIAGLSLFTGGLGLDRISDILCNILKARFIDYTQTVAKASGVKMSKVPVKHATWDRKNKRWVDTDVKLPASPVFTGGVILAPERFLKDIPRVSAGSFWGWAENNHAQELRDDLNYDLSKDLTLQQRAVRGHELARKRPTFVKAYLEVVENSVLLPYDVEADPKGLVRWHEAGKEAAFGRMSPADAPEDASDFTTFIDRLAKDFQAAVEQTDLWVSLWQHDSGRHVAEPVVQAVAGAMWTIECKNANVDLSVEVNRGRGPLDFKFSQGWKRRALLEVKLMDNSKFFAGANKQLPQYLKTEKIDYGVYLCVGFKDADFEADRIKRVQDTVDAIKKEAGVTIKPVFVDARKDTKTSASKLKDGTP